MYTSFGICLQSDNKDDVIHVTVCDVTTTVFRFRGRVHYVLHVHVYQPHERSNRGIADTHNNEVTQIILLHSFSTASGV